MAQILCSGRGDIDGGHCCYIEGKVCQFLDQSGDVPRCGIWDELGGPEWQNAPVGRMFAERWPGYTCIDWPQNIPQVMEVGIGLCCWGDR